MSSLERVIKEQQAEIDDLKEIISRERIALGNRHDELEGVIKSIWRLLNNKMIKEGWDKSKKAEFEMFFANKMDVWHELNDLGFCERCFSFDCHCQGED